MTRPRIVIQCSGARNRWRHRWRWRTDYQRTSWGGADLQSRWCESCGRWWIDVIGFPA